MPDIVSSREVVKLIEVLELTPGTTFQRLSEEFEERFPDPTSYFRVCSGLSQLLHGSDLLGGPVQELRAVFLIYDAFREGGPQENPFLSLLMKLLLLHPSPPTESSSSSSSSSGCTKATTAGVTQAPGLAVGTMARLGPQSRWFLSKLLVTAADATSGTGLQDTDAELRALLAATPEEILAKPISECTACDTSNLQVLLMEQLAELPSADRIGVSCVLSDPEPDDQPSSAVPASSSGKDAFSESGDHRRESAVELLTREEAYGSFTPVFYRIPPPLHLGEDPLCWIEPVSDYVDKFQLLWDESMCATNSAGCETKRLLARAFKQALTPNQQAALVAELKKEPRKIIQLGLTPARLPALVENNPAVAVEVLMQRSDCSHLPEFYSALVNMELSLHSMEVVNQLTTATELPAEFIHQYVSNCIATCETIKDRYMQNRLVRLVCVFLSSLIRNRLIDVRELLIEVQAFCIDFSRIKEAASLFRLLKNVD